MALEAVMATIGMSGAAARWRRRRYRRRRRRWWRRQRRQRLHGRGRERKRAARCQPPKAQFAAVLRGIIAFRETPRVVCPRSAPRELPYHGDPSAARSRPPALRGEPACRVLTSICCAAGSCRYRCHRPARGVWSPRPEVLEAFARGRWRGNWSDGTHGEGLTNEWCPSRHKADGAPQHRILFFGRAALRDCQRGRHLVFVGDSSMRIWFSALVSMVNGTRESIRSRPGCSRARRRCRSRRSSVGRRPATTAATMSTTSSSLASASMPATARG